MPFEKHASENASGISSILIGLILLFLPGTSARFVVVLLGLWALLKGGAYLYTWVQMPESDPERTTARNVGAASLLLGAVLIIWPATGQVVIAVRESAIIAEQQDEDLPGEGRYL